MWAVCALCAPVCRTRVCVSFLSRFSLWLYFWNLTHRVSHYVYGLLLSFAAIVCRCFHCSFTLLYIIACRQLCQTAHHTHAQTRTHPMIKLALKFLVFGGTENPDLHLRRARLIRWCYTPTIIYFGIAYDESMDECACALLTVHIESHVRSKQYHRTEEF